MKKRKILHFLILFYIFLSCNEQKDYEHGRIDLKSGFENNELKLLSDVAEDIEYVFFETNDKCLMSAIDKVVYDPPYYFVMDDRQKHIFIFDETGKFENTISAVGQGPHDYTYIDDFDVHENILYILDRSLKKILKYEMNGKCSGTFVTKNKESASGIKVNNEGSILLAIRNDYLITFEGDEIPEHIDASTKYKREGFIFSEYDRDFNFKRKFKYMKYMDWDFSYLTSNFYSQKDTLVYWEYNIFDTVYTILPDGNTKARYILDPGKLKPTLIIKREDGNKVFPSLFKITNIVETDDLLFLSGIYKLYATKLLYNNKENKTTGIEESLMNDIDGGISFWPSFKLSDNKVGRSFYPDKIKDYIKRSAAELKKGNEFYKTYKPKVDYDKEKHKKLLEQLEKTDDMSNPVLMIVTMKSNSNHEE